AAPGVARWARVHAPAAQLNGHDDGDRRVELPHCVPPAAVKPTRRTAGALMGRNHPMTTFPGIQVHNDTAGTTKLLACRRMSRVCEIGFEKIDKRCGRLPKVRQLGCVREDLDAPTLLPRAEPAQLLTEPIHQKKRRA